MIRNQGIGDSEGRRRGGGKGGEVISFSMNKGINKIEAK